MGQQIRLHGLDRLQYDATRPASLRKSGTDAAQFYQLKVKPIDRDPNPKYGSNAPVVFHNGLKAILSGYNGIFAIPTGLPPAREHDYHIPLLFGTALVNVKPYRYPYFQKSKIEKLVDGIIQPSNSLFSSPVLLVKKKDGA